MPLHADDESSRRQLDRSMSPSPALAVTTSTVTQRSMAWWCEQRTVALFT